MRTGATVFSLLTIVAVSLFVRQRWPTLQPTSRRYWLAGAVLGILARSLSDVLRWELTFSRFNDLLLWTRIAGYILLAILFTRFRPRLLTVPAALILLLPLLSASVYLPLEFLFDPTPRLRTTIGNRIVIEQTPWQRSGSENRAVDYTVSQRSKWLPFLERTYRVGRFYRTQCDSDAISASLIRESTVILHCPAGAPGDQPVNEEIRLTDASRQTASAVIPSKP